jgi:hypothetical protein
VRAPILSLLASSLLASLLASALAVSAGCSSSSSGPSTSGPAGTVGPITGGGANATSAVSGTRLRVKSITGGGAREVVSFHDMERNEDCSFQPAESGRKRCLPPMAPASQTGLFADPGCQVPSVSAPVPTCAGETKYGLTITYDGCSGGTPTEVRKFLDPATPRYTQGPSGCSVAPVLPATPNRPATVPLGDVVPWTAFVEGTEMVVAGSPVSEKVLVATDGARQHLGYRDEKLGADCSYRLMSDGVTRCVPGAQQGQVYYADGACTRPLAVNDYSNSGGGCNTTPSDAVLSNVWLEPSPSVCGGIKNVYRVGTYSDRLAGANIFQLTNQDSTGSSGSPGSPGAVTPGCSMSGTISSGSNNYRTIGDNLNGSLPTTPRVSNGSDRLVAALVWPPAADGLAPGWHDTMSDVDCTFALTADGKMRCLPVASAATILFTDDACKSPTLIAVLSDPSCIGSVRRFARVVSTTCPPTTRVFSIGADVRNLASASVATTSGQCGKVSQVTSGFDATEVDVSQFMEGIAAVE